LESGETQNLDSVMAAIAAVGVDADRDTLVSTIDQSIDTILGAIKELDDAAPLPDNLLSTIKVSLEFLEACSQIGDDDFKDHIKSRTLELHQDFQQAVEKRNGTDQNGPAAEGQSTHDSFEEGFADYFCEFMGELLSEFHVEADLADPKPYMLVPAFTDAFLAGVRKYAVPEILNARRMRNMADSVSRESFHRDFFYEQFQLPQEENVVQLLWSNTMDDFRSLLKDSDVVAENKKTKDKGEKKKGGLLSGLKKKKKEPAKTSHNKGSEKQNKAEEFWLSLADNANEIGYDPPRLSDFSLFRVLMEYKLDSIQDNKNAIRQLLQQEVVEGEGREGATRDWLYKVVERMPAHAGELVVLYSLMAYSELFSPQLVKSFLLGQGTTEESRSRVVPLFTRWVEMSEIIDEDEEQEDHLEEQD